MVVNGPGCPYIPGNTLQQIQYWQQRSESNGYSIYSYRPRMTGNESDDIRLCTYTGKTYNLFNPEDYKDAMQTGGVLIVEGYRQYAPEQTLRTRIFKRTSSMDGKIDAVKQGMTGDCWLLAALNSMSYSDKGRKILSELIKYGEDGAFVEFKGIGKTVFVPYKSVFQIKQNLPYSRGDDDVKIIELAMEKVLKEAMEGNLGRPFQEGLQKNGAGNSINPLNGKFAGLAWALLLGKDRNYNVSNNLTDVPDNAEFISFAVLPKDKDDKTLSGPPIFGGGKIVVRDVETGKKISLNRWHEYSIKKIENGDIIEIVDPQNNQKSFKIKASDLKDCYFEYYTLDN